METLFQNFLLCFIPLLVAIDVIAVVPLYLSLIEDMTGEEKRTLLLQSLVTALTVALVFLATGKWIFKVMGITEADFRVGGGLVLLIISISDLVNSKLEKRRSAGKDVGIVPIGIPLIMGPAAMTTLLVSSKSYGYAMTTLSLFVNLLIVWVAFRYSSKIIKICGEGGAKAMGKVASLFMTAIAIAMIRSGITLMLK